MSEPKERVTVSLEAEVVRALKGAADHAGSPSVSQYVEDTLRARMDRDSWLERWRAAAGPTDPEALAHARRALLGAGAGTVDHQRHRAS